MVDALANRIAAGLDARRTAEMFVAGGRSSSQANASTGQGDPTDGPAVIKTISSDGDNAHRAAWNQMLEERGLGHVTKMSGEERGARTQAYFDDISQRMHISVELRLMERGRATLPDNERIYAKMSSSKPVPPKELLGEERKAALNLMDKLGIPKSTFGHDTSIFVHEGTRYLLHRDGKLEAHDAEIAPSQEEKTRWLEAYARQITYGKADPTTLQAEYDALTARVGATRAELFKNLPSTSAKVGSTEQPAEEYSKHIVFG